MSDGDYAEMIEIPVSTCETVILPKKHKKKNLRKKVIEKVNRNLEIEKSTPIEEVTSDFQAESVKPLKDKKKKLSFDIVSAQIVAIFVLVVAILLTNIFWEDSGINNLIHSVFNNQQEETKQIDNRDYSSFNVFSPSKATDVAVENGVMTVKGESSIYSPCAGTVESVVKTDDKYTMTINHNGRFKTVIKNADYAYYDMGESVFEAMPVCYSLAGGVEISMYGDNTLLTNYTINNGAIVWQS